MNLAFFLRTLDKKKDWFSRALKISLSACSQIYKLAIQIRNHWYDTRENQKLPFPVVSIGNITTGGTGKTPAVIKFAQILTQLGAFPIILSRGYGKDEILLFQEILPHVPHFWAKKRFQAGIQALQKFSKPNIVFLLDDGFQHRSLHRDLDVVLIDATDPFGMGHLLPRGFLREPVTRLKQAPVILLTKSNLVSENELAALLKILKENIARDSSVFPCSHVLCGIRELKTNSAHPFDALKNCHAFLFTGIGNPSSFYCLAQKLEVHIAATHDFPDHHQYTQQDSIALSQKASDCGAQCMITTAKDAVKLANFSFSVPVFIADIQLQIEEKGLIEILQKITTSIGLQVVIF